MEVRGIHLSNNTPVRPPFGFLPPIPPATSAQGGHPAHDIRFLELLSAYRATGGLAVGAEIAARRPDTGLSDLARSIAARALISFSWSGQIWLPVFQFEPGDVVVRAPVRAVVDELTVALNDWEIADWFIQRNPWLNGAAPIQLVYLDVARLLDAARALRFACCS